METFQKILALAVILLLIAGIVIFRGDLRSHAKQVSTTTVTGTPELLKGSLLLIGQCQPCSYDNVNSYSASQQEQDISMLKGLGDTAIRIDLGYDVWLQNDQSLIDRETQVINYVKSQGLTLIIADASAERYRSFPLPWLQFKEAWAERVGTIASLYHPNYYFVIKEPGWYVPMVSDSRTNPLFQSVSDWENLTQWLSSKVISVSPTTAIGVSISADGLNSQPTFYKGYLTSLPNQVRIIGFDTYTTTSNQATQQFLATYGSQGKIIWDAEAWSEPNANSNPNTDPSWIATQYNFCVTEKISGFNPFYTDNFIAYGTTPSSFVASTPVSQEMAAIATING